ncbi:hypothetical protein [Methylobacterium radiotolerans]|uniref:hypothetical protein n=1 Tax=Methylobacterium radiotolerans TaxID=31998 RepID=UPI00237F44E1|nr:MULTISPECIES: hypothetical protein [Methylobacterium]MDE3750004.1 hypothetical protein [Methylobacterium radiotolerans]
MPLSMTATVTPRPVKPRAYAVAALIAPKPQPRLYSGVSNCAAVRGTPKASNVEGERAGTVCAATGPSASASVASELPTSNPRRTASRRRVPPPAPVLGSQDPVVFSTSIYF